MHAKLPSLERQKNMLLFAVMVEYGTLSSVHKIKYRGTTSTDASKRFQFHY